MKILLLLLCSLLLAGCGDPLLPSSYKVSAPKIPLSWKDIDDGSLRWRLEWFSADGMQRSIEAGTQGLPDIDIGCEQPSAILAYPYSDKIAVGILRPAGAIFPYDALKDEKARETCIQLSWEGGFDAEFFIAVLKEAESSGRSDRRPQKLDWPRFRRTLADDPWEADLKSAAKKAVQSSFPAKNFPKRQGKAILAKLPCEGTWFSASPFKPALVSTADESIELQAGDTVDYLICKEGIFKYTADVQMFIKF
ncbi:MAG: hypothetical protein LBM77_02700 [Spirochaetaceae bacterium]|jgi:hypothetical protein|nr:hypothetical protein [Spirochaetaceae bacterium]